MIVSFLKVEGKVLNDLKTLHRLQVVQIIFRGEIALLSNSLLDKVYVRDSRACRKALLIFADPKLAFCLEIVVCKE